MLSKLFQPLPALARPASDSEHRPRHARADGWPRKTRALVGRLQQWWRTRARKPQHAQDVGATALVDIDGPTSDRVGESVPIEEMPDIDPFPLTSRHGHPTPEMASCNNEELARSPTDAAARPSPPVATNTVEEYAPLPPACLALQAAVNAAPDPDVSTGPADVFRGDSGMSTATSHLQLAFDLENSALLAGAAAHAPTADDLANAPPNDASGPPEESSFNAATATPGHSIHTAVHPDVPRDDPPPYFRGPQAHSPSTNGVRTPFTAAPSLYRATTGHTSISTDTIANLNEVENRLVFLPNVPIQDRLFELGRCVGPVKRMFRQIDIIVSSSTVFNRELNELEQDSEDHGAMISYFQQGRGWLESAVDQEGAQRVESSEEAFKLIHRAFQYAGLDLWHERLANGNLGPDVSGPSMPVTPGPVHYGQRAADELQSVPISRDEQDPSVVATTGHNMPEPVIADPSQQDGDVSEALAGSSTSNRLSAVGNRLSQGTLMAIWEDGERTFAMVDSARSAFE